MSHQITVAAAGLLVLATAVWVGGFAAIAVVARVATRTLDPASRVSFFRSLGRAYGVIGLAALAVAYATGAALLSGRAWTAPSTAAAVLAAALVATTAVGMAQARRMGRLRRRATIATDDAQLAALVHRGAAVARGLRGLIGLETLALLCLGVVLAS